MVHVGEDLGYQTTVTSETAVDAGTAVPASRRAADDHAHESRATIACCCTSSPKSRPARSIRARRCPTRRTTELETDVMLNDGEGMIIGGLIDEKDTPRRSKVPYLGDLWRVGFLFRKSDVHQGAQGSRSSRCAADSAVRRRLPELRAGRVGPRGDAAVPRAAVLHRSAVRRRTCRTASAWPGRTFRRRRICRRIEPHAVQLLRGAVAALLRAARSRIRDRTSSTSTRHEFQAEQGGEVAASAPIRAPCRQLLRGSRKRGRRRARRRASTCRRNLPTEGSYYAPGDDSIISDEP